MQDRALVTPVGGDAVEEYRFRRPAKMLGLETVFADLGEMETESVAKRAWLKWMIEHGTDYSIVWTNDYRDYSSAMSDTIREANGARIIVDVDDYFSDVPLGNQASAAWYGKRKKQYKALLDDADVVLTSTPWLAQKYGGIVAPNFIDLKEWSGERRKKKSQNEVVICCPAGVGRAGDYAEIREPLKAALELPHVKVLFVGVMPSWALEYPVGKIVYSRWIPTDKYGRVMKYYSPDIIVSPMLHNDFNLAKSNLKWLESGAVGACFMGERWGEYQRTVLDGVTGVLADTEDEWTQKLLWLCTEHDARKEIAAECAKDVAKNWTWDAVKDAWIQGVLGDGASDNRVACGAG